MKLNRDLFSDVVLVVLTGLVVYEPNKYLVVMASLAFINHTLRWALTDRKALAAHTETLRLGAEALARTAAKVETLDQTVQSISLAHNAMVKQYEHTKKLMSDMQLASAFIPRAKRREGPGQVA